MNIPRIIHQVYEDIAGPPEEFIKMSNSWKNNNPQWQYMFWGKNEIESLLKDFPELINDYNRLPYNVQRWDIIRLLILYKYGGLYVDFDYECFRSIDTLFEDGKSCYIGLEPFQHALNNGMNKIIGNAFVASTPKHCFIKYVIDNIFPYDFIPDVSFNRGHYIMNSTGPFFLTKVYDKYSFKDDITLIKPDLVTPLTLEQVQYYHNGTLDVTAKAKLEKSFAVHFYAGTWWNRDTLQANILNYLIINSMTIDISLANGLSGIVIILYELSRTSQNDILVKLTDDLVDRVLRDFNHLPYTFSEGIVGIACGIQYLIDNRFLGANEDVFEELDVEIFKLNRSNYKISNNYSDYCGPILYYLSRTSNNKDQKWIDEALIFIEKNIVFSIETCNQFNISGKYIISLVMFVTHIPKLPNHIIKKIDIFISSKLDQLLNSELFVLNFLVMKSDNFIITKEKIKVPEKNDFLEIAKIVQVLGIIDRDISITFKTQIEIATSQVDFNKSQLGLAGLAGLGLALI